MNQDKNLILRLGGPTKVCHLLGFDKTKGGAQRVQNWMRRGIPPKVKLTYPELFLAPGDPVPTLADESGSAQP